MQNAPATLEQPVAQQEVMQPLTQQESALEAWKTNPFGEPGGDLASVAKGSPEMIAEQMKQQATQGVKHHLTNHTEAVQEGQQQLAELKKKYQQVQSEQDRYERATSLKGEPWTARLLLGSYFQLYRQPHIQVDVSPFVGYRFNTRWSVGLGGSYRLPGSVPVYQARIFAESVLYQGFLGHVAYERSWLLPPFATAGEAGTIAAHHLLVGIGKTYRITKRIQGTTLVLFRPGPRSQPLNLARWNLRTGVYLSR